MSMKEANVAKYAKTKNHKARRLARKLKEAEKKRLKDGLTKFRYEIKDNNIIKVKENI